MIVVDASVAVKWFVDELGSAAAARLLSTAPSIKHGPDLLLIEVTATMIRLANQRTISREDASDTIRDWTSVAHDRVVLHRTDDRLVTHAARIALDLGHPLKDCIYLALALELGCPLLTADAKFQARAAERHTEVRLLG